MATPPVRSVERVIPAPPPAIFALLADPSRHHEFDGSGTVHDVAHGGGPVHLGSRFGVRMENGIRYTSANEVVELEPDRRIAWRTATQVGGRELFGGQTWRYELEDRGDGSTLVRESFDLTTARPAGLLDRIAGARAERGMAATLERLATLLG